MRTNNYLIVGALSGCLTVIIGAFGAHALKKILVGQLLSTYHIATDYQMYHSLALVCVAILMMHVQSRVLLWSARFFILGIVLFSGSLYLLCITGINWLGIITPIGGLSFILGWLTLAIFAINHLKS